MKFPSLYQLATTHVISIDISATIDEAIALMLGHNHRNIIIIDGKNYRLLMVSDLIYIKKNAIDRSLGLATLNLPSIVALPKDTNILKCIEYINAHIDYICTLNSDGSLHGLITLTDIISHIDPDTLIENYTLQEYLDLSSSVMQANEDEIVIELFEQFERSSFDSIVVTQNQSPIGILTAKDILRAFKNTIDLDVPIKELMSSPIQTLPANSTVKDALEFIHSKNFKRVIVVDKKGYLAGAITQKELITLTYSRWSQLIKEHYSELKEINKMLQIQNHEYRLKASRDHLTKLYNRHYFSELFEQRREYKEPHEGFDILLLMDVDDFKQINDTLGHNEGDRVLVAIAKTLLSSLRGNDIAARWGGEEFIVLLPTNNLDSARRVAQKIHDNIAMLTTHHKPITLSIGITPCYANEKLESIIARADQALYHAKASGKNCMKVIE